MFNEHFEIRERCKGVHCVDLGESFPTSIYLQNLASIPNHFRRLATPDNTPADRRLHVFTTVSLLFQFSNALGNFEPKL